MNVVAERAKERAIRPQSVVAYEDDECCEMARLLVQLPPPAAQYGSTARNCKS